MYENAVIYDFSLEQSNGSSDPYKEKSKTMSRINWDGSCFIFHRALHRITASMYLFAHC